MSSDYQYISDETLLSVKDLCVNYSMPILKNVNINITDLKRPGLTQGQKVALLAPSGMGKTQLFKRLAGLEKPDSGTVLVGTDQKAVQAGQVGMVPQNYLLFDHKTVEQSLMTAARMREKDPQKARAAVNELVEEFDLQSRLQAYPCQLSGGQRQRVSIAEQLLSSNHFLLMDEPFSGLDIISKKKVCETIDRVASRDELNTIIFSTHDVEAAVSVADHILMLGRDRDKDGHSVPGAYIKESIDLIEMNLAWHPDVEHMPNFMAVVQQIKAVFMTL